MRVFRWFNRLRRDQQGVTLLELIVVVAIIGILSFTITPRILQALDDSRLNAAVAIGNELHSSLERYYAAQMPPAYPFFPGGSAGWADLRAKLQDVVGLSANTGKVFKDGSFTYKSADGATYCLSYQSQSKGNPTVRVTPDGVDYGVGVAGCP